MEEEVSSQVWVRAGVMFAKNRGGRDLGLGNFQL